jgi:putative permease
VNGEHILDISWGTIFKIGFGFLIFYILYLIRDILILFIFALIVSILFNPAIDFLKRKRIPHSLAVLFIYVIFFGLLSVVIYFSIGIFGSELKNLVPLLSQYFEKISPPLRGLGLQAFDNIENFISLLGGTLEKMATNIFNVFFNIFGGIFSTIFVITIAVFLSLEENWPEKTLSLIFPKKYEAYVLSIWERCQKKVSGWFSTRIIACIFVGVVSYVAFLVFGVKYPFSLALLAGVLNFIPIVGPIITGLLIITIVAFDPTTTSNQTVRTIFVLITFVLIQQIENNILTPILSKKFIDLPPVLVLVALVVGGTLWGFWGAILATPLAGILYEFSREFLQKRKTERPIVL